MFFLNLSAGEFFALLGSLGGLIAALYLLDRSRRKKVVSTLRFWTPGGRVEQRRKRRHVLEPWSLLLQLASLTLLLLAIAQVQWGSRAGIGRDHVLLLDTSSASAGRVREGTVMSKEKALAKKYLQRLSSRDRAMLVRVDDLATPATPFTSDRTVLREHLDASESTSLGLNMERALSYARQVRNWGSEAPGEIVYFGPGRTNDRESGTAAPSNVRFVFVPTSTDNCGITAIDVEPGEQFNEWRAVIKLKNYGPEARPVRVETSFAGSSFTPRVIVLNAAQVKTLNYEFVTGTAGQLSVRLTPGDSFPADDQASLELPKRQLQRAAVFTSREDLLRPLLDANHGIEVRYFRPSEYQPRPSADLAILDQFAPSPRPRIASLYLDPPRRGTPLPVKTTATKATIAQWSSDPGLGDGLHTRDLTVPHANVFQSFDGDVAVASVPEGPVVVARSNRNREAAWAVIGFDVLSEPLKFNVATPFLFANLMRWAAPAMFRTGQFSAQGVGLVQVPLDAGERAESVRVTEAGGTAVPFTLRNNDLQFFVRRPELVHVTSGKRDRVLSLTLPEVPQFDWKPAADIRTGLPGFTENAASAVDLWRWLAVLGGIGLSIEWLLFGRKQAGAARMMTKGLGLAAIGAALFAPRMTFPETKTGTVVLVDVSNSISPENLKHASEFVDQMERHKGRNWMKAIPFASHTRALLPEQTVRGLDLVRVSSRGEATWTDATNLEAALTESMGAMPATYIPRIVLLTDGNENQGSTVRAMAELEELHVPVDTVPLARHSGEDLKLLSVSAPREAYTGEQIPIIVVVDSPREAHAMIEISAEGKSLGRESAELKSGTNTLRVHARIETDGTITLAGKIAAAGLTSLTFARAIELQRATVLYVSQDPAATENNLMQAFAQAKFNVTRDFSRLDGGADSVQLVVLNNLDLNAIPERRKRELSQYVREGGGLLLIGGERQVYKEDRDMDALDRVLPAKLAPPKTPEGICVVLIIDKSSSMEGRKIDLAKLSASGVVDNLRPIDTIGVLMFDNSYQWAVPLRRVRDKAGIKRLIAGITPDGGTQIAPALAEAYRKALASKASFKHIVLLTDGISEEGDSVELAKEALFHQVTISTVGLGQDVNRSYLDKIAGASGGRSYFLNEPQGLEQILLKDVQDYSGSTAVEKALKPVVEEKAEILDGVDMENAPPLKGYARFVAQPGADTVLRIGDEREDPLYVRWQYGLGRAAVFTSDAKSRWAESWVTWPGFDKFWNNVTRDLLSHQEQTEANAEFESANDDVVVTYRSAVPAAHVPPIYVVGPNGLKRQIDLTHIADGLYRGRVHTGRITGLVRVRPEIESRDFPETGIYVDDREARDRGVNKGLLRELAAVTGGRFDPAPAAVFDADGRSVNASRQLWPGLLALAICLTIAELMARKRSFRFLWSTFQAAKGHSVR
ncbi:MAG: VWA domain-containing protein [Acidobacteriota bacterium]|nr:VWA domain-containing protein [Acidobacteriota bacterium]